MDIKQLRAFLAVYEEGSFSKAAERINATQPGLSVRIATLELELKAALFERHHRGIVPTSAGHRLYELGLKIIHDTNRAVTTIQSLGESISGTLTVGIPPTLSKAILAPVLSEYVRRLPDVDIRIVEAYSIRLIPLLESRDIDIAIVTPVPNHPRISYTPIYTDRFVIVSGPDLSIPPKLRVNLDREATYKLVIPSTRHGLYKLLGEPFETGRIRARRTMEIDGLSGTLEFVAATDWAALLPYAAVHAGEAGLRVNRIDGEDITIRYFIATAATEPVSPAAEKFVELVKKELDRIAGKWDRMEADLRWHFQ
jgi:DNA-binding transcriptional LysR family regulator